MKRYPVLFFAAILMMTVSCGRQADRANTRITEYLYGVEYDDYDFQSGIAYFDKFKPVYAGCSEARKGDFVGRNLDWFINNDASAVIRVNGNGTRFASIGVMGCCPQFDVEFARSGDYSKIYDILPLFTVDGVNEKGLYCGVNVMPTGETSMDSTRWDTGSWGLGAAFTNPDSGNTYCVTYLVRYLLDNASSVTDARRIVESVNWYEPSGFPKEGRSQAFHWLICDAQTSAVLEFVDNKPCFIESDVTDEPSFSTVMTNFTNKVMSESGLVQPAGAGYERWDILAAAYPGAEESFDGIQNLMKKVWYTHLYTDDPLSDNFFMTEIASSEHPAPMLYRNVEFQQTDEWKDICAGIKADFKNSDNWHSDKTTLLYTTHTSVYSLSGRELRLMLHEGYDNQKKTHAFSLAGTHFAKPLMKE